ncbi:hypothetical protein P7K49_017196 [Saguinus oedipus]|uniref:Uncharacterized protein n=1 Tax=Saguinus oedipus TaxID=9490 RepID=A0ABQ9V227_SAGOE|nr:hypothetical protein P7K49_017196 [Saguinus oedipus]
MAGRLVRAGSFGDRQPGCARRCWGFVTCHGPGSKMRPLAGCLSSQAEAARRPGPFAPHPSIQSRTRHPSMVPLPPSQPHAASETGPLRAPPRLPSPSRDYGTRAWQGNGAAGWLRGPLALLTQRLGTAPPGQVGRGRAA